MFFGILPAPEKILQNQSIKTISNNYRNSLAFGLLQPRRGPAVERIPPRRNSLPSNGKSSKLPLLLRFNLPKRLRKPPKLLLL